MQPLRVLELLLQPRGAVDAASLAEELRAAGATLTRGDAHFRRPPWSLQSAGTRDRYASFEVGGVRLCDDPRGWGTWAELYPDTAPCSLAALAGRVGPLHRAPRAPGRIGGPLTSTARVTSGDQELVLTLEHQEDSVVSVRVLYPRRG